MEENKEIQLQRIFPTHDRQGIMNFKVDDCLYGIIYCMATYRPPFEKDEHGVFYITKKNFAKNKKQMMKKLGMNIDDPKACDRNRKKIARHLEKLIAEGLLMEEEISTTFPKEKESNDTDPETEKDEMKTVTSYVFNLGEYKNFKMVDISLVEYIVKWNCPSMLRIYLWLLKKYHWKEETDDTYIFTMKEIAEAFGYAEKSKDEYVELSNALQTLKEEGIICYSEFYDTVFDKNGKSIPSPRKRLTFVAEIMDQVTPLDKTMRHPKRKQRRKKSKQRI